MLDAERRGSGDEQDSCVTEVSGVDVDVVALFVFCDINRKAPYQCNVLIGGYDAAPYGKGTSLYSCDYLGTLHKLSFAAEGYAQYFVLSTLDRYWKKNLSLEQGVDVIEKCIAEIQKRLVINQPRFCIKVVDKDGIRVVKHVGGMDSGRGKEAGGDTVMGEVKS